MAAVNVNSPVPLLLRFLRSKGNHFRSKQKYRSEAQASQYLHKRLRVNSVSQ